MKASTKRIRLEADQEERDLDRFANSGKPFRLYEGGYTDKDIRIFKIGDYIPKSYSSYSAGGRISRIDFNKNDDRFIYITYLVGCVVNTTVMGKMEDVVHPDYWEQCREKMSEIDEWARYQRKRSALQAKMAPYQSELMDVENAWRNGRFS